MVPARGAVMNGAGRLLTQHAPGFGLEASGKEVAAPGFPTVDSWERGWQDAPGLAEGLPPASCWGVGGGGRFLAGIGRVEVRCLWLESMWLLSVAP